MMTLVILALVVGVVVGPLWWAKWAERRADRAQAVVALIEDGVNRALGGESLVEVRAASGRPWRAGQVVLSIPADWSCLVEPVWKASLARLPRGWDLLVEPGPRARLHSAVCDEHLGLAA